MKIVLLTTQVPFVYDDQGPLIETLACRLREAGHKAEVIKLPFRSSPAERIVDEILSARLIQLWGVDQVIGVGFPAYFVRHDRKVVWLLRQYPPVYEFWDTEYQTIPSTPEGKAIRTSIIQADNEFLREAQRVFTKSRLAQQRLRCCNGLETEVLRPPLPDRERYGCAEFGDYLVCLACAAPDRRAFLPVEAMRHVKSGVRLVLLVEADRQEEPHPLIAMVARNALHDRVQIITRQLSHTERALLFANALGCVYVPYLDDSVGIPTLESFQSGKPLITCTDSGATLELVENLVTGLVTPPNGRELADAMDRLMLDRLLAERLGRSAHEKMKAIDYSWDKVIRALVL